jgi:hypothetical protein
MKLSGKRVAILATHGFEQSELEVPLAKLKEAGAKVDVVSPETGQIKGWDMKDWGQPVKVDRSLSDASVDDYDAIVLPGGQINPDLLRINDKALEFIRAFFDQKKVVAAICHLAADRNRHHQGPQSDVLPIDQDRRDQRRRQVGGFSRRGRPGRDYVAPARRPRSLLREDYRGDRRGPTHQAQRGGLASRRGSGDCR